MKRRFAILAAGAILIFTALLGRPSFRPPALRSGRSDAATRSNGTSLVGGSTETALPESAVAELPPQAGPKVQERTSELLIFLRPEMDALAFARSLGLKLKRTVVGASHVHVFEAAGPDAAAALRDQLENDPRVTGAYLNERRDFKHCYIPNDPNFGNGPAPLHGQWHLGNGSPAVVHANLAGAWSKEATGQGVIIAVVDDCLEKNHPDLAPNFLAADSWNYGTLTNDPSPNPAYDGTANEDAHGTSTSGVAAARGGNGLGVTGAAPFAGLAGLRIDWPNQDSSMFVGATLYHSSDTNTNIKVKSHSYGYTAPYIATAPESQAVDTSTAAGTIHCFAAGNNRTGTAQDSNTTMPQNNPNAIAVAAIGADGKFSYYSSFGSNVFVTAPSNGVSGYGIMTTDRMGNFGYNTATDSDTFADTNYTSTFGGTSSATPLVAGILTLGKQVRPNLSLRFAKHALARSSVQVDPTDNTAIGGGDGVTAGSAWKTNAAGFKFNQNYGFGMIDAGAFVQKLYEIDGVTPDVAPLVVGPVAVASGAIPDNNPTGISRTFTLPAAASPLEEIQVKLTITHGRRGQLEAYLTSPSGTTGRLFYRSGDTGSNINNWTYTTNQFWGEPSAGTWTLKIVDTTNPFSGTWTSYMITARTGTILSNTTAPSVASIVRGSPDPTNASSVNYVVTFSEPVTGVDAADFALTSTGTIAGASITGVTGSFCVYTVSVNTGTGDGTLRLDVVDNDTIQDSLGNKLGGAGAGNGNFTSGPVYTIDKSVPAVLSVSSTALNGAYNTGTLPITVTFTEPVIVTGTPQLRLATGGAGTLVNYSSGSGTAVLTFNYTIAAGHNSPDLDYFSTGALTLNGGTIKDVVNDASLTLASPGTAGSLGANKNLVIDTTAPAAPSAPDLVAASDTGSSATDNVTGDTTPTFSGTAEPGATVKLFAGAVQVGSVAADGAGNWSITSSALVGGTYSFTATATDAAANTGPASGGLSVTIDASAPAAPSTPDLAAASDTGTSNTDNLTSLTTLTFNGTAESGATVQIFIDGIGNATGTAAGGSWSIAVSSLTEGGHSITAQATDAAGNVGPLSGALAITIDTTPPATPTVPDLQAASDTGSSSTDNITNLTSVSFLSTVGGGATVEIFIDGVGTGLGSGAAIPITAGVHNITARATDAAGNVGPFSTALSVTVDTTPPVAPSIPDLITDTGANTTDNITSANTPTFSGTSEPNALVKLFAGASQVGSATADGAGSWSITTSLIADGTYSFTATATDVAGNTGPASGGLSVTIITAPPAAPSTPDLADASDTGASITDNITKLTTLTFNGTAVSGTTVQIFVDGVGNATGTATGGNYSIVVGPLTAGGHNITAQATDAIGNVSPLSGTLAITIDTSAPAAPAGLALDSASDSGSSNSDRITKFTTLTFTGTAENNATVQILVDGTPAGSGTATGGAWSIAVGPIAAGNRSITATATDAAGNTSGATAPLSVTIDTSVPAAPSVPDLTTDTGTNTTDNITSVTSPSFAGTAEIGATVKLFAGAVQVGTAVANGAGNWSITSSVLAEGTYSFTATATDVAGNTSAASGGLSVTIDSTAPLAPSTPDLADASDTGTSNTDNLTKLTGVTFTGTSEAGSTVQLFIDGNPGPTGAGGSWSIAATLTAGVHSITARATDGAGNLGPASGALAVTVDTSAPAAPTGVALDPTSDSGSSNSDRITKLTTLTFTGSAENGATVQLLVDGAPAGTATATGGTWSISAGPIAAGVRSITATATDAAGNTGTASAPLSVTVDTTAPVAPSTPDLDALSDTGNNTDNLTSLTTLSFSGTAEAGASVQLFVDGVAGNTTTATGGNWTLSAAGLSTGAHAITARATDTAGNLSPVSGTLTVTIDTSAPSAPSTPDLVDLSDTGTSNTDNLTKLTSLTFTGTAEDGSLVKLLVDNVQAGTATATGGSWTITALGLAAGARSITATSTDTAGNVSPASGALVVTIDTTAPTTPARPTLDAASDTGSSSTDAITTLHVLSFSGTTEAGAIVKLFADVTQVGTVVAGPGGAYTVTSSSLPDGAYAITVTATDAAGNVSAASASLALIIDNTAPPTGIVLDGVGADIDFQSSATTLKANWSGFDDPESGILKYEVAIGTTPFGTEVQGFVDVGTATTASRGPFSLAEGQTYYVTVRATNPLDQQSTATSDGVKIDTIAPAPPGSLLAIPGDASATLIWTASPSGDVDHYRAWWKPASSGWGSATMVDNLPGPSAVIPGLTNGVLTDFKLVAVDGAGNESTELFASATPQPSVQIQGGGSFPTIQDAIDAASAGQTILIGPGLYVGDLLLPSGVSIQGWAPGFTILQGTGAGPVITVLGSLGSTISGLTVTGGLAGISAASADLTVHNVIVHHVSGPAITHGAAGSLTAVNVTLMANTGDGVFSTATTQVRNSIAGGNGGVGYNVPGSSVTYSDAYTNTIGNFSGGNSGGAGNISVAAIFVDEAGNDYRTMPSSPTADAGDPDDDFSLEPDPNGGRIDMGAFGNTVWASLTTAPPPKKKGGGGGGGCGLLGLEALALLLLRRKR